MSLLIEITALGSEKITGEIIAERAGTPDLYATALAALAYADLFDYPLTLEQVVRFQVGTQYDHAEIASCLRQMVGASGEASNSGALYCLRGRETTFQVRRQREQVSARIWRRARLWARIVARTPFVRMVAVTGALSMNNIVGKPDIDLLVLTQPGRVWICRRLLILQVRLARLFGDDLCPNYILSSQHLELDQRDFFTAHELAQMVPLYGQTLYREMLAHNGWSRRFLPAAFPRPSRVIKQTSVQRRKRLSERLLGASLFDAWEAWELRRLRRKLAPQIGMAAEVVCSPEQCKGHTGLHRSSVLMRFRERLEQLGIWEQFANLFEAGIE